MTAGAQTLRAGLAAYHEMQRRADAQRRRDALAASYGYARALAALVAGVAGAPDRRDVGAAADRRAAGRCLR